MYCILIIDCDYFFSAMRWCMGSLHYFLRAHSRVSLPAAFALEVESAQRQQWVCLVSTYLSRQNLHWNSSLQKNIVQRKRSFLAELELLKEQENESQSRKMRMFMCFALFRNIKRLFSGECKATDIKAFYGIRAIAIFFITRTNTARWKKIRNPAAEALVLPGLKVNLFPYSVLLSTSATLNAYQI